MEQQRIERAVFYRSPNLHEKPNITFVLCWPNESFFDALSRNLRECCGKVDSAPLYRHDNETVEAFRERCYARRDELCNT